MKPAVSRAPGSERVVTPLELFFDLVYVFAIGELAHHLLAHVDVRTGVETAILALAVVYAWFMTAWGLNWLDPDNLAVRLLLVGLMFASLIAIAVGDELAIAHPGDDPTLGFTLLSFGGAALFVLAQRLFMAQTDGSASRPRHVAHGAHLVLALDQTRDAGRARR